MADTLLVSTRKKTEVVNVTALIGDCIGSRESRPEKALAHLSLPHTTAALFLGEDDEELRQDFIKAAEEWLGPLEPFRHVRNQNPNAAAHILSSLFGNGILIPVENGALVLGSYQNILLLEMDGPKERKIRVELFGSEGERP
jgi:secondary thiamine-phosphate synthase enzyme